MEIFLKAYVAAFLTASDLSFVNLVSGVMASFAGLGDIIVAEPKALIGFTGPRVIEQTIKQKLPEGFQSSDFMLEHGLIDIIVHRRQLKDTISSLLDYLS